MRARLVLLLAALMVCCAALMTFAPWFASAHHQNVSDSNDTPGSFDVKVVKTFGRERPGWRIVTFKKWSAFETWDRGYLLVYLDTFGDNAFDYYALVNSYGKGMQGRLWRDLGNDREIGQVAVWRTGDHSVSMRLSLDRVRMGRKRAFFRWYAKTLWRGGSCRRTCFDRVPESGGVVEPVVGPSPTTSPLPTPSPTTSPSESPGR